MRVHLLEHKSPHVVAKPIGVQLLSLEAFEGGIGETKGKFPHLEVELGLHPGGKSVVDRLVELDQHSEGFIVSALWVGMNLQKNWGLYI